MQSDARAVGTKVSIIRAANKVIRETGPAALTLESVARTAGVSKGGLLYHFPGKEALIVGMLEHALSTFESDVNALASETPDAPGAWIKAFVTVTFAAQPEHDLSTSMLAAASVDMALLEPVSRYFANWQARAVERSYDPATASIIRLAADGIFFGDLFTTTAPQGHERQTILNRLLEMVDADYLSEAKE